MLFTSNAEIRCHYPAQNLVSSREPVFHWRHFRVAKVRDLYTHPLSVQEFLRRPFQRRCRYLLEVWDIANRRRRHVYPSSMMEYWHDCPLKIGIYPVIGEPPAAILTRQFGASPEERILMCQVLRDHIDNDSVGIFSDICPRLKRPLPN